MNLQLSHIGYSISTKIFSGTNSFSISSIGRLFRAVIGLSRYSPSIPISSVSFAMLRCRSLLSKPIQLLVNVNLLLILLKLSSCFNVWSIINCSWPRFWYILLNSLYILSAAFCLCFWGILEFQSTFTVGGLLFIVSWWIVTVRTASKTSIFFRFFETLLSSSVKWPKWQNAELHFLGHWMPNSFEVGNIFKLSLIFGKSYLKAIFWCWPPHDWASSPLFIESWSIGGCEFRYRDLWSCLCMKPRGCCWTLISVSQKRFPDYAKHLITRDPIRIVNCCLVFGGLTFVASDGSWSRRHPAQPPTPKV